MNKRSLIASLILLLSILACNLPVHTTEFKNADTKTVEDSFNPSPSAGSYWVRLIATIPNSKVGEAKYKITCP